MTREDIIRMAREAGLICEFSPVTAWLESTDLTPYLTRFAQAAYAAGAAAAKAEEREACAGLLDKMAAEDKWTNYYKVAANAIRARGAATSRSNNDD